MTSTSQFLTLNPQFPTALNLSVTQPLFRNLAIDATRHQITVAQKNATLSNDQFRAQLMDIVAAAEQAYWQLVFAAQSLAVQTEGLQLAQQQAASNARRAQAGVLAPIDAIEAMTQVASRSRTCTRHSRRSRPPRPVEDADAADRDDRCGASD